MAEKLSGIKKHFNSQTLNGRANVAKVVYGAFAMWYIIHRFTRKKKIVPKPEEPLPNPTPSIVEPNPDPSSPKPNCECYEKCCEDTVGADAYKDGKSTTNTLPGDYCGDSECGEVVSNKDNIIPDPIDLDLVAEQASIAAVSA